MKKFGVLVISYDNKLFRETDALRKKAFDKINVPTYFAYNGPGSGYINKESMYLKSTDMNPTMYNKLVLACDYLLKNDWKDVDYIVRSNSSTFLNPDILNEHIQNLPSENCFAGSDLRGTLISGMFMVFSKDVVRKIIENGLLPIGHHLNGYYDDEGICMQMLKWGIPRTILPSPPVFEDLTSIEQAEQIDYKSLVNNLGVRIRNFHDRELLDLYLWRKLTDLYLNGGGSQ